MISLYLLAGVITYGVMGKRKKSIVDKGNPDIFGIRMTCKSIQLIDKTKFHNFLKTKIYQILHNELLTIIDLNYLNLTDFVLAVFEEVNKSCYLKFKSKNLISVEKIVLMLFFSEIIDVIDKEIKSHGLNEDLFNIKVLDFIKYAEKEMNAEKEAEDFELIYENYKSTYKYP